MHNTYIRYNKFHKNGNTNFDILLFDKLSNYQFLNWNNYDIYYYYMHIYYSICKISIRNVLHIINVNYNIFSILSPEVYGVAVYAWE